MSIQNSVSLNNTYARFMGAKTSSKVRSYVDNELHEKNHNKALRITSYSILGASLLSVGIFHKKAGNVFKNTRKHLQKALDKQVRLEKQIENYQKKQNKTQTGMFLLKTKHFVTSSVSKLLTAVTNTDPLRNYYFGVKTADLAKKSKYTKFFAQATTGITRYFGKLVKNTSVKKYRIVEDKLKDAEEPINNFIKELNKNPEAKKTAKFIKEEFIALKKEVTELSNGKTDRALDLDKKLKDFAMEYGEHTENQLKNIIKNSETRQEIAKENIEGFVAEKIAKKHTEPWKQSIIDNRNSITNSLENKIEQIESITDNLQQDLIGLTSKKADLKSILANLDVIKNLSLDITKKESKAQKAKINDVFGDKIKDVLKEMNKDKEVFANPLDQIKKVEHIFNSKDFGHIEKIRMEMKNYKGSIDLEQYSLVKEKLNALKKSVNKAVKFETDNLEGRQRDLALGGGVFEVVTTIIPLGLLTRQLAKKQTPEERTEKALKVGLPVVGGMGAWAYSALVKCYNGPKAVLFSLGAGIALNKIGDFITKNNKTLVAARALRQNNNKKIL